MTTTKSLFFWSELTHENDGLGPWVDGKSQRLAPGTKIEIVPGFHEYGRRQLVKSAAGYAWLYPDEMTV